MPDPHHDGLRLTQTLRLLPPLDHRWFTWTPGGHPVSAMTERAMDDGELDRRRYQALVDTVRE